MKPETRILCCHAVRRIVLWTLDGPAHGLTPAQYEHGMRLLERPWAPEEGPAENLLDFTKQAVLSDEERRAWRALLHVVPWDDRDNFRGEVRHLAQITFLGNLPDHTPWARVEELIEALKARGLVYARMDLQPQRVWISDLTSSQSCTCGTPWRAPVPEPRPNWASDAALRYAGGYSLFPLPEGQYWDEEWEHTDEEGYAAALFTNEHLVGLPHCDYMAVARTLLERFGDRHELSRAMQCWELQFRYGFRWVAAHESERHYISTIRGAIAAQRLAEGLR